MNKIPARLREPNPNTNIIEVDEVNPISQNQGRQANTNIEPDIIELPNEQHVDAVAAVADTEDRNEQVQQIAIRPQEYNPNNTSRSLNDSLAFPQRHNRLESTRRTDNMVRNRARDNILRNVEHIRTYIDRHPPADQVFVPAERQEEHNRQLIFK